MLEAGIQQGAETGLAGRSKADQISHKITHSLVLQE